MKDPTGTEHEYSYDQHGRLLHDSVTKLQHDLDPAVRRISRTYDPAGRWTLVTSWDNAASGGSAAVVNEVKLETNSWGQLTADRQAHSAAVDAATPAVPVGVVGYAYADGSANHLRRTGMTFPNNRMVQYDHDAGVDFRLGRLTRVRLADGAAFTTVLTPVYAGVGKPVKMTYPQPGLQWTLLAQSGKNTSGNKIPYTGLDRFGRIIEARWLTTAATPATRVHVNYWYDRGSRRIWRETPNAPTGNKEAESYLYDGLSQVTRRQRGALERDSQGAILGIAAPPEREEEFAFDTLGNWQQYTVKTPDLANPPAQTTVFDHTRSHNAANQITGFSNTTQPVTHDPSGNTTQIAPSPAGNWSQSVKFTWDAWNRLIAVHDAGTNAELARHAYDGLTRRTWLREGGTSGTVRHFFYNDQWRSIEERLGSSAAAERQHLFHPANRWHLILRDRDTDANGTLDERLYALHDAMDPVAVADTSGGVTERYSYSAFGQRRVMDASFADQSGGTAKAWNWDFHGDFSDSATGLHNYGYRYFAPVLGRWLGRDPIGERESPNLFDFAFNGPIRTHDFLGLKPTENIAIKKLAEVAKDVPEPNLDPMCVGEESKRSADMYFSVAAAIQNWRQTALTAKSNLLATEYGSYICRKCCEIEGRSVYCYIVRTIRGVGDGVKSYDKGLTCPEGYEAISGSHSHPGNPSALPTREDRGRFNEIKIHADLRGLQLRVEQLKMSEENLNRIVDFNDSEFVGGVFEKNIFSVRMINQARPNAPSETKDLPDRPTPAPAGCPGHPPS